MSLFACIFTPADFVAGIHVISHYILVNKKLDSDSEHQTSNFSQ